LAAIFICSLAASIALTPLCRLAAIRLGYVARPREDRWHKKPTALLGGIGVATVTLGGLGVLGVASAIWPIVACAGAMFLIGFVDDLLNFKASTKLIAEIAVASTLVFFGYRLGWTQSLTGDAMLTLLWVVGITNAFNLLDNMDGLCAGIALIAGFSLIVVLGPVAPAPVTIYITLLLGATAGFLVYNLNPASIFLGDGGSLFIGSSLALLTLAGPQDAGTRNVLAVVAGPVFLLLIPIFDTTLVTLSRLIYGRSPSRGGRDHSSHRLVAVGLSERAAVTVLWSLAALSGAVGISFSSISSDWSGLLAALFLLAMVIFAVYLAHVRVYDQVDHEMLRSGRMTPFMADFMYKRRVAEVVLDTCLVSLSYYAAYRLRFEDDAWQAAFPVFLDSLPIVLAVQMIALFAAGAYRGVWRHFTVSDGLVFVTSTVMGTVGSAVVLRSIGHDPVATPVFVIYALLLLVLACGSRASFRIIGEFVTHRRRTGDRVVIYGASDGGQIAIQELLNVAGSPYRIIGFVDDDKLTHHSRFHGYFVLGGPELLPGMVARGEVDAVVVSLRAIEVERLKALEATCRAGNVELIWLRVDLHRITTPSAAVRALGT
jgi:UDP-GlcNAc:undecaprenyl-phosphate GlcNAc-1-phosphate transferase